MSAKEDSCSLDMADQCTCGATEEKAEGLSLCINRIEQVSTILLHVLCVSHVLEQRCQALHVSRLFASLSGKRALGSAVRTDGASNCGKYVCFSWHVFAAATKNYQ